MNQLKWIQRTKVRIPLNNQFNDILLICNVLFSTGFSRNALWFKKGRTLLIVSNSAIHMGMYPNLHLTIFLFLGNHRTILEERSSCQKHFIFFYTADIPGNTRQFIATVNNNCRDFNGVLTRCHKWKDMGFCFKYRRQMQHVCNKTCQYCGKYYNSPIGSLLITNI